MIVYKWQLFPYNIVIPLPVSERGIPERMGGAVDGRWSEGCVEASSGSTAKSL
jgi:hypothetical protein